MGDCLEYELVDDFEGIFTYQEGFGEEVDMMV